MHLLPKSLTSAFGKVAAAGTGLVAPFIIPTAALAQDGGFMSSAFTHTGALNAGAVSFASPMMLAGLASLPALWWLMRSVPPKPLIHAFPAIKLLFNLKSEDQEPARMPVWQRLLRLSMVTAVITGLAHPILNPSEDFKADGTLLLVVDNGWASAHNWDARVKEMEMLITQAKNDNRPVMIMPTAPKAGETAVDMMGPMTAEEALANIQSIQPTSWKVDHNGALTSLNAVSKDKPLVTYWLGNGIGTQGGTALAQSLLEYGTLKITTDAADQTPVLLSRTDTQGNDLSVTLRRLKADDARDYTLSALDVSGHVMQQMDTRLDKGQVETTISFDVAPELRGQLSRITVVGENSAGSTLLLDEQWQNRPVGIISSDERQNDPSVFNDTAYIQQALTPFTDTRLGSVANLLDKDLSVMVMTDSAPTSAEDREAIKTWIDNGGTLLRFAGPKMALDNNDDLLPVKLREGDRSTDGLGSSMSGKLAPFPKGSPFNGIQIPSDVVVNRSVLAEPSLDLDDKTWARLEDGTPLVTAEERGNGRIILVHTSADTSWSNIPLSGLFIDMAKTAISKSRSVPGGAVSTDSTLPPLQVLNGKGQLVDAPEGVQALSPEAIDNKQVTAVTPPGLYGYNNGKYAHNLGASVNRFEPFTAGDNAIETGVYAADTKQNDLRGALYTAGFGLLIADLLVLLGQQGHLPSIRRRKTAPKKTI